jgi:para-nitrobenzyl esterase
MRALEGKVAIMLDRRRFMHGSVVLCAATRSGILPHSAWSTEPEFVVAETSNGKVRGVSINGIKVFKGIPYGGDTGGRNRFMPPTPVAKWTGIKDSLEFGYSAPQTDVRKPGSPGYSEDCLAINVWTSSVNGGKRPVMVYFHGGGFTHGSPSSPIYEGVNLAHTHDVVLVTMNHRLNLFGATYLAEAAGPDFADSGAVGMLDLVASLRWVKDNISRFGGDPNLVTIFGHSGGGRKVATMLAMPSGKGLFQHAIVQSGAVLRLTTKEDAIVQTDALLRELNIDRSKARELQNVHMERLLEANAAANKKIRLGETGESLNSPVVDGRSIPQHPWDPVGPAVSANIPLMIGWARTEETAFDKPTPEKMAMDEAGLRERVKTRLGVADPEPIIAAFRETYPNESPWDTYILIASNHPRGLYTEELGKRKVMQGSAHAWVYRVDWETPEGGGQMHSPHGVELPFVFDNVKVAGPRISKMPEAYAMEDRMSNTWASFARSGNPNNSTIPNWPVYSVPKRETMIFNNECRAVNDPQHVARLAMEKVLKLS